MPPVAEAPKTTDKPADTTTLPQPGDKPAAAPGAGAQTFLERQAGIKKKPAAKVDPATPQPDKPTDTPPADKPAATPDKPAAPKKKEAPKPVAIPPEPALSADEIAAAAARGVASEFTKSKEAEKPKPPTITDGLDAKEQKRYEVLARMEKDFGDTYAGRAKQFAESTKKAKKYQTEWEGRNPGKKFDPDDDEHDEFFSENEVDWDDDDYATTLANMAAEKMLAKQGEKENKKLTALEQKDREREAEPKITASKRAAAKSFFGALGDDFKDVISEDGKVNNSEVKRLLDADPIRAEIFNAAESVEQFATEIYRLTNGLASYQEGNKSHEFIGQFWQDQEILLKNLPSDQQLDDRGRRFATMDEYAAMSPAKKAYYWTLQPDDVATMYAASEVKLAQERVKAEENRLDKIASARGYVKKAAEQTAAPTPPAKPEETPAPPTPKPNSPSGAIAPTPALPPVHRGPNGESKVSTFIQRMQGLR